MQLEIGSTWLCTEEEEEQFGTIGIVVFVNDGPGWNGEGTIKINHGDYTHEMKVRRFLGRYRQIKT